MAVIYSDFKSPWWLPGGNLQTQLAVWVRWDFSVGDWVSIETRDGDQLSASWHKGPGQSKTLIVMTHGLEGSNRQPYISGAIRYIQSNGLAGETPDILAWNLRGCGARENKTHKIYFAGCVDDLDDVIAWAENHGYENILLIGYSLGANITLRWLGNFGPTVLARRIKAVCTASATIDLQSTVNKLDKLNSFIYRLYFIFSMKFRLKNKAKKYPGFVKISDLSKVYGFNDYDKYFSAPLNGFSSQEALYQASSAVHLLDNIKVPCLIVQAQNDPFLAKESFPLLALENHSLVTLEICKTGGHVGFLNNKCEWYLDKRFLSFFQMLFDKT